MAEHPPRLTRHGFLVTIRSLIAASAVGVVVGPITAYFWPKDLQETPKTPISLGNEGTIPVGGSKTVRFGRNPAIAINLEQFGLVAYSAICTHFACVVKWNPESGMIECPCHAGFYDPRDGSVISGPPPLPIEKFKISKEGGTIYLETLS